MTGSSGVSGTLRPFDSITGASGILGRPVKPKPGDDTGRHPLTKSNTSLAFSAMMMAVLGPVKAWPGNAGARGKASATANLDGPCARRTSAPAGRDEGTAARHEQRNSANPGGYR